MLDTLLFIFGLFVIWAVSVYVYPFRACRRCGGTGHKRGSNRRRFGICHRCGGAGRVQRIGSRSAHRFVLSVTPEMARERQRRRDRRAAENATDPHRLENRP